MPRIPTISRTSRTVTKAFAAEPGQVIVIRAYVRQNACDIPVAELMVLAVSELATNAIRHSRPLADGTISVAVTVGEGTARVAVTDGGHSSSTPRLRTPEPGAVSGRGLQLVDALAARWGFTPGPAGSTTWSEFDWPADH